MNLSGPMNIYKNLAVAALALLSCGAASAQDKIRLRSGELVKAKVLEVSTREVLFKVWENQDGPDYRLKRGEIRSITYANGTEERFSRVGPDRPFDIHNPKSDEDYAKAQAREQAKYGNNIISVAPMQMCEYSAVGFGVQYERVVDKRGIVSVVLPVGVSFIEGSNYSYYGSYPVYDDAYSRQAYYSFYPGVKIYPTGNKGKVRYGVGAAMAFGFGQKEYYTEQMNAASVIQFSQVSEDVLRAGVMVNNSLNIQPTPKFYLGLELGLGFPYTQNRLNNFDNGGTPMVQFAFRTGYRF